LRQTANGIEDNEKNGGKERRRGPAEGRFKTFWRIDKEGAKGAMGQVRR